MGLTSFSQTKTVENFKCYLDSIYATKNVEEIITGLKVPITLGVITEKEIRENKDNLGSLLVDRQAPGLYIIWEAWRKQ